MKTIYAAPTIVANGDAVTQTKVQSGGFEGPLGPGQAPGTVGFNL